MFAGVEAEFEVLTMKRIRYVETKYKCHIILCKKDSSGRIEMLRKTKNIKYDKQIHLLLHEDLPQTENGSIENFSLVQKSGLPKRFICKNTINCRYETDRVYDYHRHIAICGGPAQVFTCKQTVYGNQSPVMRKMIEMNLLPLSALDFTSPIIASYDIETMEVPIDFCRPQTGTVTNAYLKLLSIAIGSNIQNYKPKCWIR